MRRSHLEIVAKILETAKNGANKFRIMCRCNLNYLRMEDLLSSLLETGLLTIGNSYHTTEKGLRFLEAYHALKLLLDEKN